MLSSTPDWDAFADLIANNQRFFLASHMNPDGDALGSSLGLYHYLRGLGKSVHYCNPTPTPHIYRFLDPGGKHVHVFKEHMKSEIMEADVIIILDVSMFPRLGTMEPHVRDSKAKKVVIDHHMIDEAPIVDMILQDSSASSAGEMVYRYVREQGDEITLEMAEPLYVAVMTDTGSFRFSSSTPTAHKMAAELIDIGVDPRRLYGEVYENGTMSRMALLSKVLSKLQTCGDGQVVYVSITRKMMQETKATREEIEGFVEYILGIRGVEVSLLFVESPPKNIKVSLRSKGRYNINTVATKFGGGGHILASGILIRNIKLQDALDKVIRFTEEVIANTHD
jgi:bifunctional oligoribonuclease and PAP phosphatase NrnA